MAVTLGVRYPVSYGIADGGTRFRRRTSIGSTRSSRASRSTSRSIAELPTSLPPAVFHLAWPRPGICTDGMPDSAAQPAQPAVAFGGELELEDRAMCLR